MHHGDGYSNLYLRKNKNIGKTTPFTPPGAYTLLFYHNRINIVGTPEERGEGGRVSKENSKGQKREK